MHVQRKAAAAIAGALMVCAAAMGGAHQAVRPQSPPPAQGATTPDVATPRTAQSGAPRPGAAGQAGDGQRRPGMRGAPVEEPAPPPEPGTIAISTAMPAPAWALAERALLAVNADGARAYAAQYHDVRGYLKTPERWGVSDGPDDAMENIRNWPIAHALGGPDVLIEEWERAWEGHLQQFTSAKVPEVPMAKDGIFYKEFITSFDWEHTSEGLSGFYFYGLSRPIDARHQARARRFSGFYMNEDPGAPNYDAKLKIVKSLFNGSRGPQLTPATADDWDGPAFAGVSEARRTRFRMSSNIRGDHPLNLNVANLVFHAYLLTQDRKYRDWVLEYVNAWRDRSEKNGGNIPSNVGLDGTIGGEWGGKWYGGVFGWNSPDEGDRNYVFRGPPEAFGAALLLTGDQRYTQVLRRQIDNLYAAKKVENGQTLLPRRFGDQGWYDYHPLVGGPSGTLGNLSLVATDIYMWGLQPGDLARLPQGGWLGYLATGDPNYPLAALQEGLAEVHRAGARIRRDASASPGGRGGMAGTGGNAVSTTALVNLTMGANDPGGSSHGPLPLHAQVRHFDPVRRRAGLPPDVGALVGKIRPDGITLALVNLHPLETRTVLVQMGAYGEHHATTVTSAKGQQTTIDAPVFTVRLSPGAGETLTLGMRRYAHQPTLAFPWDRSWMATKDASAGATPGTQASH